MPNRRVGGVILIKKNGELFQAKGEFSYDLGVAKRDAVVGPDGPHGFSEKPKPPFIEGAITDSDEISLQDFFAFRDATVTLELANGKVIVLREAYYAGDGTVTTDEGEAVFRAEGMRADEIR